jgi:hypothetical protein
MLIEKLEEVPKWIKDKFLKIVNKNWGHYHSEHLFSIQRILEIFNIEGEISPKEDLITIE